MAIENLTSLKQRSLAETVFLENQAKAESGYGQQQYQHLYDGMKVGE
jgi:hypothetical protein